MESTLYYSDISYSSEEDCPEFNPWIDVTSLEYDERVEELEEENTSEMNPATFLAEVQVFATEPLNNKPLVVGLLKYEQQQQLNQLLVEFEEVCAKSQTEIGRTTRIKH